MVDATLVSIEKTNTGKVHFRRVGFLRKNKGMSYKYSWANFFYIYSTRTWV